MVRERGIPERINRNSLGVMVGPGPLGNAIVLLCCCVSADCRAIIVRWDLMNRTWDEKRGGVDARAAGVLAFPHQTAEGCLFHPGLQDDALFLHETPSVSSFFDETLRFFSSSSRRICSQSLGRIRVK